MDSSKKEILVCYVEIDKVLIYQDSIGSIIQVDFPQDVILDQEIANKDKVEQAIEASLKTRKLEKGDVIFIFAPSLTIEKDFPNDNKVGKAEEIQKFVEIIPFEDVLSRNYSINKKTKVVGINRELYDMIKNIFERQNLFVLGVIPSTILQETVVELSKSFDLSVIASKVYFLKQYSIVNVDEPSNSQNVAGKSIISKKMRKYVLIGTPIIILVIVAVLFLLSSLSNNSKSTPSSSVLPTSSPTPFSSPFEEPTPEEIKPFISSPSGDQIGI